MNNDELHEQLVARMDALSERRQAILAAAEVLAEKTRPIRDAVRELRPVADLSRPDLQSLIARAREQSRQAAERIRAVTAGISTEDQLQREQYVRLRQLWKRRNLLTGGRLEQWFDAGIGVGRQDLAEIERAARDIDGLVRRWRPELDEDKPASATEQTEEADASD